LWIKQDSVEIRESVSVTELPKYQEALIYVLHTSIYRVLCADGSELIASFLITHSDL